MEFINRHWAKFSGALGIFLVAYVYLITGHDIPLLRKYSILSLAFLMIHQFEEYVWPGGFKDYFNNNIYNPFGFIRNRITDKAVLFVNIVYGWGLALIVILFLYQNIIAVVSLIGIIFINGLAHFFITFKSRDYNPGVVTGAVLFIPLTLYFINKLFTLNLLDYTGLLKASPFILFGSLMIPYIIYLNRDKNDRK